MCAYEEHKIEMPTLCAYCLARFGTSAFPMHSMALLLWPKQTVFGFISKLPLSLCHKLFKTSEMIHHCGASLSKQHTAGLLICHGTQQDLSLSTV